ncbi:MAG: P-loop NTPase [Clostridia bacterium]|nr:P-loop NTPase [Clostridia bacterium]
MWRCRAAIPWRPDEAKLQMKEAEKMGRIFAIMSGKGGVGKSTISAALAECYARRGKKVALLDGDIGLRCADLMLGMQDRVVFDLGDLTEDKCPLDQALVSHPVLPNLSLLAAPQMLRPSDVKAKKMKKIIDTLASRMDVVILDAPAGIGRGLKNLLNAQADSIIVATPDDVSLRDAEKLNALLAQRGEMNAGLIINRVNKKLIRRGEMMAPARIAAYLDMPLMGAIPESGEIYRALLQQKTALQCGDAKVTEAIGHLADRLMGIDTPIHEYYPSAIWKFFHRGGEAQA